MTPRGAVTLVSWLDSRMKREKAQAISRLPASMALKLKDLPSSRVDDLLESVPDRLRAIHYSWFQPALSRLPPEQRQTAEEALPLERGPAGLRALPALILEYWQSWLWRQIVEQDWLPQRMLRAPEGLEQLASLSKHDLMEVIDLLGVFDVIPNLRKAIHASEQKFWGEVLSATQKKLAHKLLMQPAWPGQLPLAVGSVSIPDASRTLHQRGCLRLGAALRGSHDSFLWAIVHHLDRGRGQLVQEAASETTSAEAIAAARGALEIVLRERASLQVERGV